MGDGSRYSMRRGDRERIVDVVGPVRSPASGEEPPRRLAEGSGPAIEPIRDELELLAPPAEAQTRTLQFGGVTVVVERRGDSVSIILPGAVRLVGSADQALKLAIELSKSR